MARQRVHKSNAERQAAFRGRRAAETVWAEQLAFAGDFTRALRLEAVVGRSVGAIFGAQGAEAAVGQVFGHALTPGLLVRVVAVDGERVVGEVVTPGRGRLAVGRRGHFRAEYLRALGEVVAGREDAFVEFVEVGS